MEEIKEKHEKMWVRKDETKTDGGFVPKSDAKPSSDN